MISKIFWLYIAFSVVTTTGFASFAIVGYHLKQHHIVTDVQIPLLYAFAMIVDAVTALIIGKSYDMLKAVRNNNKAGLLLLIIIPVATAIIPFLTFSFSVTAVIAGTLLWGIVMGSHETIMKSAIADITAIHKRSTGYGIFHMFYGLSLFTGSALCGFLYDFSIPVLVVTLAGLQLLSLPIFYILKKQIVYR